MSIGKLPTMGLTAHDKTHDWPGARCPRTEPTVMFISTFIVIPVCLLGLYDTITQKYCSTLEIHLYFD